MVPAQIKQIDHASNCTINLLDHNSPFLFLRHFLIFIQMFCCLSGETSALRKPFTFFGCDMDTIIEDDF